MPDGKQLDQRRPDDAERKFRALFENALDAFLLADDQGRYIEANAAACELFGTPREELLGRTITEFGHPDNPTEAQWAQFQETGKMRGEFHLRRPDGVERTLEFNAVANVLPGVNLSVLRDVTLRKRAEEDAQRGFNEAQRALKLRDEVLAEVSHDLRNPLSTILTSVELLRLGGAPQKPLDIIKRSAARMNRLIRDLLDISSIESGRLALNVCAEPVRSLLAEALEQLVPSAIGHTLRLRAPEAPPGLHALCDKDRVLQILANLVDNARKFAPAGSVIELGAEASEDEVTLTVTDAGQGIDPGHLLHLFDRFWQRKASRAGVGLGLAIVKGLVELQGGKVFVQSEPGRGTTFRFTLPRERQVANCSRSC